MNKVLAPTMSRRHLFLLGVAAVTVGVVGCGRGGGPRVVTTPPKLEGARHLLDLIKDKSAQSSPKRKTRKR
jgi:hypothetical protein